MLSLPDGALGPALKHATLVGACPADRDDFASSSSQELAKIFLYGIDVPANERRVLMRTALLMCQSKCRRPRFRNRRILGGSERRIVAEYRSN